MKLELHTGEMYDDPSAEQIASILRAGAGNDGFFAILSQSDLTYIQTAGTHESGFVLEHQIEIIEQHFICADSELSLDAVTRAFQAYAAGDEAGWQAAFDWTHMPL